VSTRVLFTGIREAQAELRAQPQALAKATQGLANRVARDARAAIKQRYPKWSGNLRDGLIIRRGSGAGKTVASAYVINTAPHAHIFEHGTVARRYFYGRDKLGRLYWEHPDRGQMPAGNVFIPTMVRYRWIFFESVKEIMQAAGITVTGEA
jgi:hypothetical protein